MVLMGHSEYNFAAIIKIARIQPLFWDICWKWWYTTGILLTNGGIWFLGNAWTIWRFCWWMLAYYWDFTGKCWYYWDFTGKCWDTTGILLRNDGILLGFYWEMLEYYLDFTEKCWDFTGKCWDTTGILLGNAGILMEFYWEMLGLTGGYDGKFWDYSEIKITTFPVLVIEKSSSIANLHIARKSTLYFQHFPICLIYARFWHQDDPQT